MVKIRTKRIKLQVMLIALELKLKMKTHRQSIRVKYSHCRVAKAAKEVKWTHIRECKIRIKQQSLQLRFSRPTTS